VTTSSAARRAAAVALLSCFGTAWAAPSVHIEALTWPELQARVRAGTTIVLVPIGGTEQNGPHMALGKHNERVRVLAERIAQRLGDALVAPVVAYVPEGQIDPPTEHMRWPGTISVPPTAFEATLEGSARSLQRAGLAHVVLLGDHGGYRASLERVAARVPRVHALPEYYRAARVGEHAGRDDTALTMAVVPAAVREDVARSRVPTARDGAVGDPRAAVAEEGAVIAERIVAESVAAIRRAVGRQSQK
jgi:creatinine amidohydrolase/Fe(II)-dependent formamide hydrolase-like protein